MRKTHVDRKLQQSCQPGAQEVITGRDTVYSRHEDSQHNLHPAKSANGPGACLLYVRSRNEVDNRYPEDNFCPVYDRVRFERLPALEDPDMVGQKLVGNENE